MAPDLISGDMMMRLVIIFSFFFTFVDEVHAFKISPLRLSINSDQEIGLVSIDNPRSKPVVFQLEVFLWTNSSNKSALEPTSDLIVMPPVVEIAPETSQLIRIAARPSVEIDGENAYRMIITEVPSEVKLDQGVNFNFRINMPIFLLSSEAKPEPNFTTVHDKHGKLKIVLNNSGKAHIHIDKLSLYRLGDENKIFDQGQNEYVFGGEHRDWLVDIEDIDPKSSFRIKAETNVGTIQAVANRTDN